MTMTWIVGGILGWCVVSIFTGPSLTSEINRTERDLRRERERDERERQFKIARQAEARRHEEFCYRRNRRFVDELCRGEDYDTAWSNAEKWASK
jgi:hypothetical protein